MALAQEGGSGVHATLPSKALLGPGKLALLVAVWAATVAGGLLWTARYKATAGTTGTVALAWPAGSALARATDRSTLLMFVHPRCPCTRASIRELGELMAHAAARLKTYVLNLKPRGTPDGFERSDLWASAARIPGVEVLADAAGAEAARFGAETSGHVLLYDRAGRLRFSGGITPARGHEGDGVWRPRLLPLIDGTGEGNGVVTSPVFGCGLLDDAPRTSAEGAEAP